MADLSTLIKRSNLLQKEILECQNIIRQAPEGKLIARTLSTGNYRYSVKKKDNKGIAKEKYIPSRDKKVAEQLAMKYYAEQKLRDLEEEKQILDQFIDFCCREKNADRYLKTHPGVGELVVPQLQKHEDYIKNWANTEYRRSMQHPEQLKYPTVIPGLAVRSKAEADWISPLVYFGIPLRYEEECIINDIVVHPDITALNVTSLEPVYIEHQGGWDQFSYVSKLSNRADLLQKIGIIPWKNLIITTETYALPLDINWVDELIRYFLM